MNRLILFAVLCVEVLACQSSPIRDSPIDGSGEPVDGAPAGAANCDCRVENGVLVMSWDCLCAAYGCGSPLCPPAGNRVYDRVDYPACGLTVVEGATFGARALVFDSSGTQVGATYVSDTSPYRCPTNPALTAQTVRGGRSPEASCLAVACGGCRTEAFPCTPSAN